MLGQRLLEKFNEYDLKEVDITFKALVSLCSELDKLEKANKISTFEDSAKGHRLPASERLKLSRKWRDLFEVAEDIDFLFIEDY